jgi:hypothetical protein
MLIFGIHYAYALMDCVVEPIAYSTPQPFSYESAILDEYMNMATLICLLYILKDSLYLDLDTAFLN